MDKLARIAMDLSENEIKQLLKLKKVGGKRLATLRAKRARAAAALAELDRKIDALSAGDEGDAGSAPKRGKRGPGRKPGRKGAAKRGRKAKANAADNTAEKAESAAKPGRRGRKASGKAKAAKTVKAARAGKKVAGKRGGNQSKWARTGLSAAIRDTFGGKGETLRSGDIMQRLEANGLTISNPAVIRRKVASILATQKKVYEMVERGLYRRID